ncbi:phospholipase D-like domain-containing protein [Terriglobus albidus]|uniref:phospholipase D-like domain-containing protein n=1 Tax=Terriglobus albidus TaxID=1592106 RepID=UPI0021DFF6F9|nr:phospholipase D-like domain-containing protein [Terriglobus albidus]
MAVVTATKGSFSVKAYIGDSKTLLAFNFASAADAKNLAGFSIYCQPPSGAKPYYLSNNLRFALPANHAQVASEPPTSTANAPVQKYRWVAFPGLMHGGTQPPAGDYLYTVTPRFFDGNGTMLPIDSSRAATVKVPVGPFAKGALTIGFTRGYMQSQAYAHHFGTATRIEPANRGLQYNTSAQAGTNAQGTPCTYNDIYAWMGASARKLVFDLLSDVENDDSLTLDVFAYDLDEPDIVTIFLKLAAQGKVRMILDDATLHIQHTDSKTHKTITPLEVPFAQQFQAMAKAPAALVRGCFDRYSHDKIFILSKNGSPIRVLTGSTNFSVTGLYVNANHVLVFDDPGVAQHYSDVFEQSWTLLQQYPNQSQAAASTFAATPLAEQPFTPTGRRVPQMSVTFSPHTLDTTQSLLSAISDRITSEAQADKGNVIFAVMQLTGSNTPVYNTLDAIHNTSTLYSYGISDAPEGTYLYKPGSPNGVLVTGRPGKTTLPPPFDQVPTPPGHEVHDKFVVCGLNGDDPVVYCGSSNLATGGEQQNGDNLLQIHDADVATAFAIEALLLVDHYSFLNRYANPKKPHAAMKTTIKAATKKAAKKTSKKATVKKTAVKTTAKKVAKKAIKKAAKKTTRNASEKTLK